MWIELSIPVLLVTIVTAALLTLVARRVALKIKLVSIPRADRYGRAVIPLGGGIAIFGSLALACLGSIATVKWLWSPGHLGGLGTHLGLQPSDFLGHVPELLIMLACAAGLFVLGLWDDLKSLGPFVKLVVQFAIALIAAFGADVRVELFIHNTVITSLLSAVWIVLMVNTFNFLDNMDGACAGIATICAGILLTAAVLSGQILVAGLGLVFIGTLLGFLLFNFPPAKIYMGDAGSLVVGFFMAVLSLRTTYYHQAHSGSWYPLLLPLIALSVPLYDFLSVTILRLKQGKNPWIGDTQHFSHRLQRRGLSDVQTVLTLYLATFCTGLGATFLYQVNRFGAIAVLLQTCLILIIVAILEMNHPHESDR